MTGKNFSCNNSKGTRKKSDFYQTPYKLTERLLEEEFFDFNVLEPACGDGAIVRVLEHYGYTVESYDQEKDFLKEGRKFKSIVTNPPFSLAKEFILKASQCADKFAFLLPLSYLHGKERFDLFYKDNSIGLSKVYIFTRYPMLDDTTPREDGKYGTGMMVYAWYIFERAAIGSNPIIKWLDNQDDVLTKKDLKNNS